MRKKRVDINEMAARYAVEGMGLSKDELFTDQLSNQMLRHLAQFGMRVAAEFGQAPPPEHVEIPTRKVPKRKPDPNLGF